MTQGRSPRRRQSANLPIEPLETRGLMSVLGAPRPAHPTDLPDRLRPASIVTSARDDLHAVSSDAAPDNAAKSAHPTNQSPPSDAARSASMRRVPPEAIAARVLIETISAAHAPVDPAGAEGLPEATAEGAGAPGVDPSGIPAMGKDGIEPASGVGSVAVADRLAPPAGRASTGSIPSDRPSTLAGATVPEKASEARARAGPRGDDARPLAIVSERMEGVPGEDEAETRAEPLDGRAPVDWEAIDGDLRQILDGLRLPGIREASRTGLAWAPWLGAAAGAYLSRRAAARRRRPFPRDRARRPAPAPLPVGPWPLSSP